MTAMKTAEIDMYVAAVAAALADLPGDVQADLLEDLPDHLAEVVAEGGETLRERLGDPAGYAAELRTAAGYPAPKTGDLPPARLAEAVAQFRNRLDRADRALGALLGYGRLLEAARSLRPGWWVMRGWIVALMITGKFLHAHWTGFVPHSDGSAIQGWLLIVVCIVASVWIGRRTARGNRQTRAIAALASVTIAVFGIFIARNVVGWDFDRYVADHGGSSCAAGCSGQLSPASSATPSSHP